MNGSSGNRTRVLGFEAQEDIRYPMDPPILFALHGDNHSGLDLSFLLLSSPCFFHRYQQFSPYRHNLQTMILSESDIGERIASGNLVVTPYSKESQQPASYDLRSAEDYLLRKGECTLVASMERVELPRDVAATLMCRSSFGRRGVLIGGGFVDPGFRGQLTLCLVNVGPEDIALSVGERVVQIIMQEVNAGTREYEGRYQDSNGAVSCR